jgi:mycothiol synthase
LGGKLLTRLLGDLKGNEVRTVTHAVKSLDSPAALFLRKHHFFIEHQEWRLALEDLEELPPVELPAGFRIDTFPLPVAIRHFRRLYDAIFAGLPWYQPYVSDREVAAELVDPADLLFLLAGKKPVGFLWTRLSIKDTAEIEPVGITVPYRGRGLARMLVLAGLRQLADQGARRVALGAWSENQVAIRLYGSLGFQRVGLLTYLAIET